jgi:hypothetical protein
MDANYVITRLKNTRYKFPTAQVLKERISNMDPHQKQQLITSLKPHLWRGSNSDIYEPLYRLMQFRR